MTTRYEDALQQVLDAVERGEPLEAALGRLPEHAGALRHDARLAAAIARLPEAVPAARTAARRSAEQRLQAQLRTGRRPSRSTRPAAWSGWRLRLAAAAALIVIAVMGAAALQLGGGAPTEAATIEGVVVDNAGGTLTVQTLEGLEQVAVPPHVAVLDPEGGAIGLEGIDAGEVVLIEAQRRGGNVVAERVQRRLDSLEAWCSDEGPRCEVLGDRLEETLTRCRAAPLACLVALDRLEPLQTRVRAAAHLERLRQACRGGDAPACRQIIALCREQPGVCGRVSVEGLPSGESGRERLRALLQACTSGDETACRQLGRLCAAFPAVCPEAGPGLTPAEAPLRPTPAGERRPAPPPVASPTPEPVRPSSETAPGEAPSRLVQETSQDAASPGERPATRTPANATSDADPDPEAHTEDARTAR